MKQETVKNYARIFSEKLLKFNMETMLKNLIHWDMMSLNIRMQFITYRH